MPALSEESETDPALAPFLALLQAELAARPAGVLPDVVGVRTEALAEEAGEVDPDAPIEGKVAL